MEVGIKESASKEEATRKLVQLVPAPLAETCHGLVHIQNLQALLLNLIREARYRLLYSA